MQSVALLLLCASGAGCHHYWCACDAGGGRRILDQRVDQHGPLMHASSLLLGDSLQPVPQRGASMSLACLHSGSNPELHPSDRFCHSILGHVRHFG